MIFEIKELNFAEKNNMKYKTDKKFKTFKSTQRTDFFYEKRKFSALFYKIFLNFKLKFPPLKYFHSKNLLI
jgi:hypothetical protein